MVSSKLFSNAYVLGRLTSRSAASTIIAQTQSSPQHPTLFKSGTTQGSSSENPNMQYPSLTGSIRSTALSNLQFGSSLETVAKVKFNQSETSVLASIGNDRTMCLYDIRTGKAERRIVMNVSFQARHHAIPAARTDHGK